MQKRTTAPVRAFATIALVGGFIALILVISTSLGGSDSTGSRGHAHTGQVARKGSGGKAKVPAAYVVQNGDTLTSIAHKTGVSVVRIQTLNPSVDPQILISGEKLKLR
ncbi:MAG TPA: LysM domain-containing protein [Solirubrobacterales bacterium]|jgi:LysM domain.|nr:LysM domain-containing protein [Solirubrobacterales bacterium]